ncbi:MAG: hypothetical protein AB8C84_03430 [Oligoflexales bacterium]
MSVWVNIFLFIFLVSCAERNQQYPKHKENKGKDSKQATQFEDWVKGVDFVELPSGEQRVMLQTSKKGIFTEYQLCSGGGVGKECEFGVSSQNIVDIPRKNLLLSSSPLEVIRLRACSLKKLKKDCTPWKERKLPADTVTTTPSVIGVDQLQIPAALQHLIFRHKELRNELKSYGAEVVQAVKSYDVDFRRTCKKDATRFISELQIEHFISIGTHGLGEGIVEFSEARVLAEMGWTQVQNETLNTRSSIGQQKRTSLLFGTMAISSGISAAASATTSIPGILPVVNTLAGGALVFYAIRDATQKEEELKKAVSCEANTKIRVLLDSIHTRLNKTNEQLQTVVRQLESLINKMKLSEVEKLSKLYPHISETLK